MQRRTLIKGFAGALFGLVLAGCVTVDTRTVKPLPIHSAIAGNFTAAQVAHAISSSAVRIQNLRIVENVPGRFVVECNYIRCQIRFTADVAYSSKGYDITFKQLFNGGRGEDYTFSYYNRLMTKFDREIQKSLFAGR